MGVALDCSVELLLLALLLLLDGLAVLSDVVAPLVSAVGDSARLRGEDAGVMVALLLPVVFFDGLALAPMEPLAPFAVALADAVALGDALAVALGDALTVAEGDAVAVADAVAPGETLALGEALVVVEAAEPAVVAVVVPVVEVVLPETPTLTPTAGLTP